MASGIRWTDGVMTPEFADDFESFDNDSVFSRKPALHRLLSPKVRTIVQLNGDKA